MFCSKCGNQMPEDSAFCNKCGTQVAESASASVQSVHTADNGFPSYAPPAPMPKPAKPWGKVLMVMSGILLSIFQLIHSVIVAAWVASEAGGGLYWSVETVLIPFSFFMPLLAGLMGVIYSLRPRKSMYITCIVLGSVCIVILLFSSAWRGSFDILLRWLPIVAFVTYIIAVVRHKPKNS